MSLKEFIIEIKDYGLKLACQNWVFSFCKWFIGARKLTAIYKNKSVKG
jgi:hypothetical protein